MSSVHVIIGEDDYLVSETAAKVVGDGQGLEVIDSGLSSNAELQLRDIAAADESFSTPPFLDPVKVTWWKNVKFLPQSKGGPSEAVKEALERFARKIASNPLPDSQKFVITGPKMLVASVFAKTLKGVAEIVSFASGKPWEKAKEAVVRVIDAASDMGLSFAPGAADAFVARVGTDTRSLMGELAKMRDYLGGRGAISEADVAEVSSQGVGVEPEVWAITDALGERNLPKALAAIRPFERESGFAVRVTTLVERFLRTLVALKDAAERGRADEATEGMAPFAARKNMGFLRAWTLRELRVARARFMALRERAVSSSGGGVDALVVAELARVCRRPAQGRRAP